MAHPGACRRFDARTSSLEAWCEAQLPAMPAAATSIARRLGAHVLGDHVEFGFWTPELTRVGLEPGSLVLELFTPLEAIGWESAERVPMRRDRIPVQQRNGFVWAAVAGVQIGRRDQFGSFYWLRYRTQDGGSHVLRDPLAHSLPYGVYGPAEVYDVAGLQRDRSDAGFFRDHGVVGPHPSPPRFGAPTNILQVHVGTATPSGSLGELTDLYRALADKVRSDAPLTPAENNFLEYDAVQLLPVEPVIERGGGRAFELVEPATGEAGSGEAGMGEASESTEVLVQLTPPDPTNWGYDVVIAGSAAVNPAMLRSGRPDELRDLAEVLHTFPGSPIRLVFDVVFGHSDNQGLALLPSEFFSGPNMYGQDMNFRNPLVRAVMLEMQRRKVDFGADGVRVDGAQDFKYWDADAGEVEYDDEYLTEMSDIVQQVAGVSYLPFMIFEDGRPWPREDWETASTYRAVIDEQPHTYQWGPLTFAHNTPCLAGFWNAKWWRIEEILAHGGHWINGCANHDTLRRGYQISKELELNRRLGDTLPEILRKSYDHPAATLLTYGIFPGVPMEFLAATMRSPWAFIRNTDDLYGVKIVAEEAGFLEWRADAERFGRADSFERMKSLGFRDPETLASCLHTLGDVVDRGEYDLKRIASEMDQEGYGSLVHDRSGSVDPEALQAFARAFMADLHETCVVSRYWDEVDDTQARFNAGVRAFRRTHRWLRRDFGQADRLERVVGPDGGTRITALRTSPDGVERVLLLANLEGDPFAASLREALRGERPGDGFRIAAAAPGVQLPAGEQVDPDFAFELADATGVLLYQRD